MAGPWEEFAQQDIGAASDKPWESFGGQDKPEQSSLTRRVLGDGGISLLKGAISVPEAAVGLADLATGGRVGKAAEGIGFRPKEAKQILDSYLTPEQQQANRNVQQVDGFVDTLGAVADNPSVIPHAVAESLPLMGAGGVIGRGIAALAPKVGPLVAGAAGEGAVMAGSAAENIRQQTEDGLLTGKQSLAALGTGVAGGLVGAAGAKAGKALGLGDVDTALVNGTLGTSTRSMPARIAGGALAEGALEEMPQSAAEQALQNYALDRELGDGVGGAAAMGLVTGGAMGAGFGAVSGRQPAEPGQPEPATATDPSEPPPLVVRRGADAPDLVQPTPTAENPAPAPVERPDPSNGPLSVAASMLPSAAADPALVTARNDQQLGQGEALPGQQQDQPAPASPEEARIREAIAGVEMRARLGGMTPILAQERARLGGELVALQQSAEEAKHAKPAIGDQRSDFYTGRNDFTSRQSDPWVNPANNRSSDPYDRFPGIDQVPPQPLEGELLTDALGGPDGQPAGQQGIGADFRPRLMREGELMGGEMVPQGLRAGIDREGATLDGQNRSMPTDPGARSMAGADTPSALEGELVGGDLQAGAARQAIDGLVIEGEMSHREQRALTTTFKKRAAAELARKSLPAPGRFTVEQQGGTFAIRQLPPPAPSIAGREIDHEWSEFVPESGTLAIPRAEMPQIKAEHRGAMVNFLNARGIQHEEQTVQAADLKPTQAEFSREKVAQAKAFTGGDRAILVSSDGHVLDGHHQWLAKREAGDDVRVIQLKAPIRDLLPAVAEFPSSTQDAGAQPMTIARPAKVPKRGQRRTVDRDRDSVVQAAIRLGGITTPWKQDTTGDTVGNKNIPGVGALWSDKTGTSLDDMASLLDQHGYVPVGEMEKDGGVYWLQEAIRDELAGSPRYAQDSARQIEAAEQELLNRYAEAVARAIDEREAEYARIEAEYGPDAAADARSFDEAIAARSEQFAGAIEDAREQQETVINGELATEADATRRDDQLRQVDGREGRAAGENTGKAFQLQQQSEAGLAEQDRQRKALEQAETEAQRKAEQKVQADAERGDFTLTGSDRPADIGAARGQNDLLGEQQKRVEQQADESVRSQRGQQPAAEQQAERPAPGQAEQSSADPKVTKPKRRPKPAAERIEDFGERLDGARKFKDYTQKLDAAKDLDVAAVPLSKSWPAADYQELLDAGSDPWGVAFMRAAREAIPNKPSKGYKLSRWVEQVQGLRGTAMRAASDPAFAERVRTKAMTEFASLQGLIGRADLYAEFGHEVSLKGISFSSHHYAIYRGEKDVTKWVVEGKPEKSALSNWPKELAVGNTREEAMAAFAALHAKMKAKPDSEVDAGSSVRFDVYTDRTTRKSFIAKKNGKRLVRMQEFDSVREAQDYLKNYQTGLEARYEAMKAPPPTRNEDNAPRIGADHRNGQDVTPELFGETFGFRGVQFGNYVENKRRIIDLNDAYDGLMDLAGILNIPPRALSLNGELGLAFGARGTGGPDPAKAHYERDSVVINLTKTNGAGSLAHEWWHALDNYLSRSRGEPDAFLTDKPYPAFAKGTRTPLEGVRPELLAAFKELNQAVGRTRMKQRAEEIDKMRTKDYWSTTVEMTARAFESYVINKLDGHGIRSDYLANIISEEGFNREEAYPYPTAAEIPVIRAAYDNIFRVIETRTDDAGNVALYSLGEVDGREDVRFSLEGSRLLAEAVVNAIAAAPELAGIQVVQSFEDLPLAVRTRAERDGVAPGSLRGVFRPDGQYLVADNLDSVDEAVHTAVHEIVGHLGVRGVLGRELDATLERIYSSEASTAKGRQRIAQIREAYAAPLSLRSAAEQRLMVAEEIIAHLAESGDRPGLLQRFVSKVRAMLRRLFPQIRWTYNDILGLIEQSRKWLQRERAASVNPGGDDNLYSLADETDTRDALRKLGLAGEEAAGMLDRIRNLTQADLKGVLGAWATRSQEGLFDGLDGIRRAEESVGVTDADQQGYVSARMASGIADVMHGVLHYAAPEWRDGVVAGKDGTRGVLEILGDLGTDNLTPWLAWLGGKRGQLLQAQGRENNLSDEDIAQLLAMADGKEALFERVYREYAQVNEAVLDLAEQAGLIDQAARAKWLTDYYVPFYRQQEGDEGLFSAPRTKRGLSHQTAAIKALKGGKLPTNDLLGNMLAGWTKRIDAAMKNKALLEVVDNLKGSDYLADESPRYQQVLISRSQIAAQIRQDRKAQRLAAEMLGLKEGANTLKVLNELMKPQNEGFEKLWTRVAPTDPDIIRVQRAGKNEYYRVNDESLLRGLKFMAGSTFNDPITKIGRAFKRILTTGVTASPDFILRNFIRDAAHAWMINKDGFVLGKDSIKGMRDALREDQDYRDLMFAGGSFQGGYVHGTDPEASAQIIRRALEKKGFSREQQEAYLGSLVNTPAKAAAMMKQGWQKYREVGDKVENANRLSTYKAALAAGKSKRQAAFEAKDLMDYSLRGNFAAAQWFTDVVPFLNARLQGLYKLGRAVKGDNSLLAREVAMKGAYIALFSLLLAGLNDDDERYQALQDWDKDMHWHIFLGEEHFRIPKPFELGLVFGTVPERLLHALTGSQGGEDLAKATSHGVFQTLAFNPVPQFYQPIRELQANRNFFRDMPIEDMADEGKLPAARYDERTSALSRTLGQLTGPATGLSPKQLDHLVMGYTGTLGGYVLSMSNMIAGAFSDAARPALNAGDIPVLKVLYQGDAVRSTQYQTEFYDMLQEAEQLHRTIRGYREEGKLEQAAMLLEANREKLRYRPALGLARKQLGNIRQKMDRVYRDTGMDAAAKRVRLDDLQRQANGVAERVTRLAGGDF